MCVGLWILLRVVSGGLFGSKAIIMNKSFQSKLVAAHAELVESGVPKNRFHSIMDISLRKLGFNIKPAFYRSFLSNSIIFGVVYFFLVTIIAYAIFWITGRAERFNIVIGIFPALLYAFLIASRYRKYKHQYKLKDWEELSN